MKGIFQDLKRKDHKRYLGGLDVFKYIGPGLLVTVGFIDPGNWASNFAAGSEFGYSLLWVVTLSTIMLIVLQHNVAHLGIVTGNNGRKQRFLFQRKAINIVLFACARRTKKRYHDSRRSTVTTQTQNKTRQNYYAIFLSMPGRHKYHLRIFAYP